MRARLNIRYALPYGDLRTCTFVIFDLSGRRVWQHRPTKLRPGQSVAAWDGRDRKGNDVAGGVYLLRMTVTSGRGITARQSVFEKRITLIR